MLSSGNVFTLSLIQSDHIKQLPTVVNLMIFYFVVKHKKKFFCNTLTLTPFFAIKPPLQRRNDCIKQKLCIFHRKWQQLRLLLYVCLPNFCSVISYHNFCIFRSALHTKYNVSQNHRILLNTIDGNIS
jgi:hypothetical protein